MRHPRMRASTLGSIGQHRASATPDLNGRTTIVRCRDERMRYSRRPTLVDFFAHLSSSSAATDIMNGLAHPETEGDEPRWITDRYRNNLIEKVRPWIFSRTSDSSSYRVSLAEMQRLHLHRLQHKLASHAKEIYKYTETVDNDGYVWARVLQEYGG